MYTYAARTPVTTSATAGAWTPVFSLIPGGRAVRLRGIKVDAGVGAPVYVLVTRRGKSQTWGGTLAYYNNAGNLCPNPSFLINNGGYPTDGSWTGPALGPLMDSWYFWENDGSVYLAGVNFYNPYNGNPTLEIGTNWGYTIPNGAVYAGNVGIASIPVSAGNQYTFSAMALSLSTTFPSGMTTQAQIKLVWSSTLNGYSYLSQNQATLSTNDVWTNISVTATAPSGAAALLPTLDCWVENGSGSNQTFGLPISAYAAFSNIMLTGPSSVGVTGGILPLTLDPAAMPQFTIYSSQVCTVPWNIVHAYGDVETLQMLSGDAGNTEWMGGDSAGLLLPANDRGCLDIQIASPAASVSTNVTMFVEENPFRGKFDLAGANTSAIKAIRSR